MLMMMEEKTDQCSHASYMYHSVDDLFDDCELQTVFKRRINIEPLFPSLLVVHTQQTHARAGISHA